MRGREKKIRVFFFKGIGGFVKLDDFLMQQVSSPAVNTILGVFGEYTCCLTVHWHLPKLVNEYKLLNAWHFG